MKFCWWFLISLYCILSNLDAVRKEFILIEQSVSLHSIHFFVSQWLKNYQASHEISVQSPVQRWKFFGFIFIWIIMIDMHYAILKMRSTRTARACVCCLDPMWCLCIQSNDLLNEMVCLQCSAINALVEHTSAAENCNNAAIMSITLLGRAVWRARSKSYT